VRVGFTLGQLDGVLDAAGVADHLHAAPAAAEGGLDRHRPAVGVAEGPHLVWGLDRLGRSGYAADAGPLGGEAGADLVAHRLDRFGWWADEDDAHVHHGAGEVGVLRVEAITGVDAIGAAATDRGEDGFGVQVALRRRL